MTPRQESAERVNKDQMARPASCHSQALQQPVAKETVHHILRGRSPCLLALSASPVNPHRCDNEAEASNEGGSNGQARAQAQGR